MLACGVQPAAYFRHGSYGLALPPWTTDRLDASAKEVQVDGELSPERLLTQGGDLLVSSPYLVENYIDRLGEVMPVVTLVDTDSLTAWRANVLLVAEALGAEVEAHAHERGVGAALAELAGQVAGARDLKVATIYGYNSSIGQEAGQSGTRAVLDRVGLCQPDRLRAENSFSVELSLETIDVANILLVTDWSSTPNDETTRELLESPFSGRCGPFASAASSCSTSSRPWAPTCHRAQHHPGRRGVRRRRNARHGRGG